MPRLKSLGITGDVGVAPRPERLVVTAAALILTGITGGLGAPIDNALFGTWPSQSYWLALGLGIVALLSAITVGQRIRHVRNQLNDTNPNR